MGRRRTGRDIQGILLLDKPAGLSSNQALQQVRRVLRARKAGHTGSLDPFATGMLPICLGEATKTAAFMLQAHKTYRAVVRLGLATGTGDTEGEVIREEPVPDLDAEQIESVLSGFHGRISQVPPMYSALKHQGQPLYKLARQGLEVERKCRQVTIHSLELVCWEKPSLTFGVHCSKGTYIRTLSEDISERLGTCGHLSSLHRIAVEPFAPDAMVSMDELEQAVRQNRDVDVLLPLDAGLAAWPELHLDRKAVARFRHGNPVPGNEYIGMTRVFDADGLILGLAEVRSDRMAHPKRVFVY